MLIFKNNSVASVMVGDCLASLRTLPDCSINACVTSPPYYGLRDYGHDGQIGLEETPDAYIARLVEVFREVRRVLTDDGTLWVNIGDSYNNSDKWGGGGANTGKHSKDSNGKVPSWEGVRRKWKGLEGTKPKDLIGIPWMLAFALRADGWYLRQDIIWHKPNPMPESVRDRCTKAHEYVFLLSKSERYFYDHEAVKEVATNAGKRVLLGEKSFSKGQAKGAGIAPSGNGTGEFYDVPETRNRRSVWTVAPKPYKGAHFAVYPPELIEPCILAGCPAGGNVLDPFGGSGTTGGVALRNGRNAILCELNPEYAALMPARIESIA